MAKPHHVLYADPVSAPCRAVLLHHAWLGGLAPDVEVKVLRLSRGEHLSDEFVALNPRHCLPTLATPHGALCESRAIMAYLAELAQHEDPDGWTAYPRTVFHRAQVHELLDWDQGTFYQAVSAFVHPRMADAGKTARPSERENRVVLMAFAYLESLLSRERRPFLTGSWPTVADASIAIGATLLDLIGYEVPDVPRVDAWRLRVADYHPGGWDEVDGPFRQWCAALEDERNSARAARDEVAKPKVDEESSLPEV